MKKVLIILLIILLLGAAAFTAYKFWPKAKVVKISGYSYTLDGSETKLYKSYFKKLQAVLIKEPIDEEEYAKYIAKIFIADFYDLNNKKSNNDIGGTQYILASAKDNMILKAKKTLYKYVESNVNNDRKQELPIVTSVTVNSIKSVVFEYNSIADDKAYEIDVTWTYKKDLGYQKEAIITIVHEDNKLSIASLE